MFKIQDSKFKRGFTLIELLVTIGILAVVAAGVVALLNPRDKILQANDAKVQNDIGQVATAAQAYAAVNNGAYPTAQGQYVPSEIQQMPLPPTGYVTPYTITYDTAAPLGETIVVAGEVQSTRSRTAAGANCSAGSTCYWKWTSGTAAVAGGPCYSGSATALSCP